MSIVRITSASFCLAEEVVERLAERLGYEVWTDDRVIAETAAKCSLEERKIQRTLAGKVSAFNNFTHERARHLAALKLALSDLALREGLILWGTAGLLLPREISHVLAVCLIADLRFRSEQAGEEKGLAPKEAEKLLHKTDEPLKLFCDFLFKKSPWDAELYDILLPLNQTPVAEAVKLIAEHAESEVVRPSESSRRAVLNFRLAAEVEMALVKAGHHVLVSAAEGVVTLTINKYTLMLSRLEEELKEIARKVPGVQEVRTKVGPGFYQPDIYRRFDFEIPSRVLLVDDEKEFVQTLSERLLMREVGTAVVYDGEQALSFVEEDTPDVIVLDLKMPGIDGIEVLRRLKKEHPEIEVIILTGHGTEQDKQLCLELGAFAYLQKPVDIEKLSRTMQEAYQKIRERDQAK